MRLDLLFLPRDAAADSFVGRAVVVFDVLRATTTMTAALAAGVREIRVFPDVASARRGAQEGGLDPKPLLCGEERCLPPVGFDLGNSPGAFSDGSVRDRPLFMTTTNGTRAILAAGGAKLLLVGALVNASAVGRALAASGLDVTLLCAGTDGRVALEDVIGAGAVIAALRRSGAVTEESDAAVLAARLFDGAKGDLRGVLGQGAGGRNVIAAGLGADIDFAADLDRFADVVGRVTGSTVGRLAPGGAGA